MLNTDVKRELDHMGRFFKMAADYKKKIGFSGQLLIEPKPKEPMKHQYDYGELGALRTSECVYHFECSTEFFYCMRGVARGKYRTQ